MGAAGIFAFLKLHYSSRIFIMRAVACTVSMAAIMRDKIFGAFCRYWYECDAWESHIFSK